MAHLGSADFASDPRYQPRVMSAGAQARQSLREEQVRAIPRQRHQRVASERPPAASVARRCSNAWWSGSALVAPVTFLGEQAVRLGSQLLPAVLTVCPAGAMCHRMRPTTSRCELTRRRLMLWSASDARQRKQRGSKQRRRPRRRRGSRRRQTGVCLMAAAACVAGRLAACLAKATAAMVWPLLVWLPPVFWTQLSLPCSACLPACLPATLVRCCCRLERQVRSKAASLPPEPPADDSEAINLLVRLPAGGRYSRRFRRTDQLQVGVHVSVHAMPAEGVPSGRGAPPSGAPVLCNHQSSPQMAAVTPSHNLHAPRTPLPAYPCLQAVFDFVDVQSGVGGDIPPGSYSLATAYPRRVLQDGAVMSLQDAGLTARQEALFLELK